MAASALAEARLGVAALRSIGLQEIDIGMKQLARKEWGKAFWHGGLATTGFFRQGIKNIGPGGEQFMHLRDRAVWTDMNLQLSPAKWQQKNVWMPIFGDTAEAAKLLKDASKTTSLYGKAVETAHKLFTGGEGLGGWSKFAGGFALADYYFTSENVQAINLMLQGAYQKRQGNSLDQKLLSTSLDHARRGSSHRVADKPTHFDSDHGNPDSLIAPYSILSRYSQQLAHQPLKPDAALSRRAGADALFNAYISPNSYAQKVEAAKGLLELAAKGGNEIPAIVAQGKLENTTVSLKRADMEDFLSTTGESLLLRAQKVLSSPDSNQDRQQLATDAAYAFTSRKDAQDRVAAAIVSLALRKSDDLDEHLSASSSINLSEAIDYLKNQAYQSSNPDIRLASADALMRTTNQWPDAMMQATFNFNKLRADWLGLDIPENKNKPKGAKPTDLQVQQAAAKLETIRQFYNTVKFDYVDMSSVCLNIANNPQFSREDRIAVLPKLGLMLDALKTEVEPGIKNITNPTARLYERANLYGRDSHVIENELMRIANNANEDKDLRALSLQVLAANSPALITAQIKNRDTNKPSNSSALNIGTESILGMNESIHGPGVQLKHAAVRINASADIEIRDLNSKAGTWITHADGKQEKIGQEWVKLKNGDQVVLGDKDKGALLNLSDDRTSRFKTLNEMAAKANSPGAIAQIYREQTTARLQLDTGKQAIPSLIERQSSRWDKYLAVKSVVESNIDPIFGEGTKSKQLAAAALADCVQSSQPDLSMSALPLLNADLISTLSNEQKAELQQTCLYFLANTHSKMDESRFSQIKELIAKNAQTIFSGADRPIQERATNLLECLLVDGKSKSMSLQRTPQVTAQGTVQNRAYPPYPIANPELRVAALRALGKIAPDRAALIAPALLSGGKVDNLTVKKDSAFVRMAALDVLSEIQPSDLHNIALNANKTEWDPAVLARLENIEYRTRRPHTDPVKEFQELDAIRHRLADRGKESLLSQGKQKVEELKQNDAQQKAKGAVLINASWFHKLTDQARGKGAGVNDNLEHAEANDFNHPEAKRARLGLVYAAEEGGEWAALELTRLCREKGAALAHELAGPLEVALTSNPQMGAQTRTLLVDAYMYLKPGENNLVTKEEAALTLMTTLQNELRRMPRTSYSDPAAYRDSLALQTTILEKAQNLPMEKMTPVLAALAQGPGPQSMNDLGQPISVRYGAQIRRDFVYGSERKIEGGVESFTEQDGKSKETTFRFVGNNTWENENGRQITGVRVNFGNFAPDRIGDLSYKEKGVSHIFPTNGSHIQIKTEGDGKKVMVTYPSGKSHREFDYGTQDPAQIEHGDYTYTIDGVRYVFDSSGAEYTINNGVTVLSKPADLAESGSSHPMQSVRAYAQATLSRLQESTELARTQAEKDLKYIATKASSPNFKPNFGPGVATAELAKRMQSSLASPNIDAQTVARTLYAGMLSKPSENNQDPRIFILQAALGDTSEYVQLAAAKLLFDSNNLPVKEEAALTIARIAKSGQQLAGLRLEAANFSNEVINRGKADNRAIMERALSGTSASPFSPKQANPQLTAEVKDTDYKRSFERVQRAIVRGQQTATLENWQDQWLNICQNNKFNLLYRSGFTSEQGRRAATVDEQRGTLTNLFSWESTKQAERDQARQGVVPDMWRQYDQFLSGAMINNDLTQALAGNILSDFQYMTGGRLDHLKARSKGIDTVCQMIEGESNQRGNLDWLIAACLTEKPDLPRTEKTKLLGALDRLVEPNGKISNDTAADIISVALEKEYHSMPGSDKADERKESLVLQEKMLYRLERWGNAQHLPLLIALTNQHNDPALRDKAAQVHAEILLRSKSPGNKKQATLVSDIGQGSW